MFWTSVCLTMSEEKFFSKKNDSLSFHYPRHCLLRLRFFGNDNDDPMQTQLNLAYEHFRRFCKSEKLSCSQQRFRPYMVSRCRSVSIWFSVLISNVFFGVCSFMKLNLLDTLCFERIVLTPNFFCFNGLDRTYHINTRRKASKSHCSRAKIYKKTGQILFTAKAFNSRCLAEWLQRCVHEALQRGLPDDETQLPLLHSALILGPFYVGFCSWLDLGSLGISL